MKKQEQSWRTHTTDFKITNKHGNQDRMLMKKECSHKSMEQSKGTCKYNQLIFEKGTKNINRERIVFSTNSCVTLGHPYAKKLTPS